MSPLLRPLPLALLLVSSPPALALSGPVREVPPRALRPEEIAARVAAEPVGSTLYFHGATFDPLAETPDFAAIGLPDGPGGFPDVRLGRERALSSGEAAESPYVVVQFRAGRLEARRELARRGVRFLGYVPDNAFLARVTPEERALLSAHADVRWVGDYRAGFKVHERLWPQGPEAKRPAPELTLLFFPDAPAAALADALGRAFPDAVRTFLGKDPEAPKARFAVPTSLRSAFVRAAASLPGVSWIEPWDAPSLHNNVSLGPVQSNVPSATSNGVCTTCTLFTRGLTGTGQIVTVVDSGVDSDMCFFRSRNGVSAVTDFDTPVPPATGAFFPDRKVVGYWVQPEASAYDNNVACGSNPPSGWHGTHTSATAVGDNPLTPSSPGTPGIDSGDGMAPNAQLLFQDIGNDSSGCLSGLGDEFDLYLQANRGGARLHSNSYGGSAGGGYTSDEQTVDRFLFDHEEMTIFFSAGNDGPTPRSIGAPANAKNILAVGAVGPGSSTTIQGFSSRGPSGDGRIKPDIVAPGAGIVSASGDSDHASQNCVTRPSSGTSMACPTVAGASALLRQYFADGFYPSGTKRAADALEARAPLVKAVLLNGAAPLPAGGTFGNNDFGWGKIFLDANLYFAGDARKLRVWNLANADGLVTGDVRTYTVSVPAGQELRVTLVWSDAEGIPSAGRALVNDLDLVVAGPTQTYLGNALGTSGESAPGGSADRLNTVEQVRLLAPAAGRYTIAVNAASVPGNGRSTTDRQGFALVASFGACSTAVAAAPIALAATSNATAGVDLAWQTAGGSSVTQVYRAPGGCSAAPGEFQYVGAAAGGAFTDARAQGGFTYGYVVRGADDCGEGPASACVSVVPTGRCDLAPSFAGLTAAVADGATCRVRLSWGAGSAACPRSANALLYNVYRSRDPFFVPGPATLLASVSGRSTYDNTTPSLTSGVTYYYVVRAEDLTQGGTGPHGGNEDRNTRKLYATALGAPGAFGTFTDGGGDGGARLVPEAPWQVTAAQANEGSLSYLAGSEGSTYPADVCGSLTTPSLTLGTGSRLTYAARYRCEFQWDGVVVEISTDGGATWADLPPTTPAGYPDTLAQTGDDPVNACRLAKTRGAFTGPGAGGNTGPAPTNWTPYETSLSPAYDGKTVKIRWRFTSDPGLEYEGFFLDSIAVTNVRLPGACADVSPERVTLDPSGTVGPRR